MKYAVVIHKDNDSDFGVTIPDLPGCFTAGDTFEDAADMAVEAAELHLEGYLEEGIESIISAAENSGCLEINTARSEQEKKALWDTRKALSPALRKIAPKKINEDVVVPVSRIPELIEHLERLSQKYNIPIVNFGHAGNGNIHVNLLTDPDDAQLQIKVQDCLQEVFQLVLSLEGTLSGEHGIGLVKKEYVDKELDEMNLSYMRAIKKQFDPDNILNPGKCLPDL